jgi:trk system potassium uptake protein TrkH
MNYAIVINKAGLVGMLLSSIMLITSAIFLGIRLYIVEPIQGSAIQALFMTGICGLLVCGGMWFTTRKRSKYFGRKEALMLVAVSWIGGALIGALPFWIWANQHPGSLAAHPFASFVNCYFESMSGLTTTGATVLSEIESLPHSLLFWRAFTHWLGGLGIVVLFVAVLPGMGVGGKRLFQIEAPGPAPEGLQPHIRETARSLWKIYLGLTVAEILLLWQVGGMSGFDAVCHTFATLATGGFSTMNASVAAYHSTPAVDIIIVVFMLLAGINFGIYYRLCRGNVSAVREDFEFRVYLGILIIGISVVCIALFVSGKPIAMVGNTTEPFSYGEALRQGVFTTLSIQTTTGFCTADFNQWPFIAKAVLICLMFVGGSSGSTAGGIKVIRIWLALKVLSAEIERVFRPHVVRPMRLGGRSVPEELRLGAVAYVLGILLLFGLGSITVMSLEQLNPDSDCDFVTAATGTVATLCNVGPGLAMVGAAENYGWFSAGSKIVMCILMALGRLEVFAIIVLLTPAFWKAH